MSQAFVVQVMNLKVTPSDPSPAATVTAVQRESLAQCAVDAPVGGAQVNVIPPPVVALPQAAQVQPTQDGDKQEGGGEMVESHLLTLRRTASRATAALVGAKFVAAVLAGVLGRRGFGLAYGD